MAADLIAILEPWFAALMDEAGRPALFDAHTTHPPIRLRRLLLAATEPDRS